MKTPDNRSSYRLALLAGVACALLPACALLAQQTSIPIQSGITLERDTVTVGEVVRLAVRIHAPRGAAINFPVAVDSLGPVQSLEPPSVRDGADTASGADRVATYSLAAWDVGLLPIRLGDVLVQTVQGEQRVSLELPSLFVRTVLPADTALRIPRPARPLLVVRPPIPWWGWALAVLALLLLGLFLGWRATRRGRAVPRHVDPYAQARTAFGRVERLRLIDAGEPGRYAALMTDVLRRYLAERLDTASLSQTSEELLRAVSGVESVSYEALRELLGTVDSVKFAAAPIGAERARSVGEDAKAIVREEHDRSAALAQTAQVGEERAA